MTQFGIKFNVIAHCVEITSCILPSRIASGIRVSASLFLLNPPPRGSVGPGVRISASLQIFSMGNILEEISPGFDSRIIVDLLL